ncbi:MAG: hypothetical protein MUO58_07965 [Anaerolineales bacterium]|nr:hypothetical protein [Anaerolineales bacterium]
MNFPWLVGVVQDEPTSNPTAAPVPTATTGKVLSVMHGYIGKTLPGLTAEFCHRWRGGKEGFATFDF